MDSDFAPGTDTPAAGAPTTRRQAREQAGRAYRSDPTSTATNPAGLQKPTPSRTPPVTTPSTSNSPAGSRRSSTPVSGPPERPARSGDLGGRPLHPGGPHLPLLLAALVALLGAGLVVVGALQATVFKPAVVTTASLSSPGTSVVSTAVGVLGLNGPRVTVTAGGAGPVFIGIGRAADVDAYLAGVSRQEIIGQKDGKLVTRHAGTQSALPDPAGVDVWVVSTRSQGHASLTWPNAAGQWRLVVATNGTSPAPATTFTWSGRTIDSKAPQLISIGLVLAIGGLITLVMLFSRSRLAVDDEEEPA